MSAKEAKARIKINRLLEEAGWCFFDDGRAKANIVLEPNVALVKFAVNTLGDNFEKTGKGFYPMNRIGLATFRGSRPRT